METYTEHLRPADLYRFIARSRQYEQWAPYGWGAAAACLSYLCGLCFPTEPGLLGASITGGAIIFGFLSTAMILLLSLENRRMTQVRGSGYLIDLVSYLREAIYVALFFVGLNLAGYFIAQPAEWFMAVWLGLLVAAFLAFRRTMKIALILLRQR